MESWHGPAVRPSCWARHPPDTLRTAADAGATKSELFHHLHNFDWLGERSAGRRRFDTGDPVAELRVIGQQFLPRAAGAERHLRASLIATVVFGGLAQRPPDAGALLRRIDGQHAEVTRRLPDADQHHACD